MSSRELDKTSTDEERYPSPDVLREMLANHGFEPDNLAQMVDMAAVGITALWWRNTKVEDWHAGANIGALSDMDMYRVNTHSTSKVRERLKTWCRQQGVRSMTDVAGADPDSLEVVVYRLYRWFTNPKRVLVTGNTLYDVVAQTLSNARAHPECDVPDDVTPESELADYEKEVAGAASYALLCMDKYDTRSVLYGPAVFSIAWATGWWGKPGYASHVDAVFAALDNPDHRIWRGKPIPAPPSGTDLATVRRLMLTRPWQIPDAVCEWLIYDIGEHYILD
ncbi:hypothetical protein [Micromonospora sp. NBC_01813]|uniref:hypothetical protein n=1 Tax=Micromonospora sp. NBC_01813 TaxID=2975988 RepID=UPI002DD7C098|nr:hypothetical protein [Micromonospora sp. NBC_01813]WSA07071.1 hypothetical protein OG958_22785 [Micromonospora sp. NBC_01813]